MIQRLLSYHISIVTARTNIRVPGLIRRKKPRPASKEKLIRGAFGVYDSSYNVI